LKHIDAFGTILLPALLLLMRSPIVFGYAKPVPVNFRALHNQRRDSILVAAAGPAMNFLLATAARRWTYSGWRAARATGNSANAAGTLRPDL